MSPVAHYLTGETGFLHHHIEDLERNLFEGKETDGYCNYPPRYTSRRGCLYYFVYKTEPELTILVMPQRILQIHGWMWL